VSRARQVTLAAWRPQCQPSARLDHIQLALPPLVQHVALEVCALCQGWIYR
jgi:hypothetical protein